MPTHARRGDHTVQRSGARFVLAVAAALTLLNAWKPLTIDDPAYYACAQQIARDPFDPYGYMLFWYEHPQNGFDIMMPTGLPYWLSLPLRLFGDRPVVVKLWLFPLAVLFVGSFHALCRRWAPGVERPLTAMTALSPLVLPSLNLMLDVPAQALALAALLLLVQACERGSLLRALAAGAVAGVSMQTKYAVLLGPGVLLLYGLSVRRMRLGLAAAAVGAAVFLAWEGLIALRYGESHLLHHAQWIRAVAATKADLLAALIGNLGGVATPVLLLGLVGLGWSRRALLAAGVAMGLGYGAIAAGPPLTPFVVCGLFGVAVVLVGAAVIWRLARSPAETEQGADGVTRFLCLWLAVEIGAYFFLAPFPATRRVMGTALVLTLLVGRLAARSAWSRGRRGVVTAVATAGVLLGLLVFAVDFRDAVVQRQAIARIAERARAAAVADVWYVGHWGFQYYAERAGMRPVVPGQSQLRAGDWLVKPEGRITQQDVILPPDNVVASGPPIELSDWLPLHTVVSYYSGQVPLAPRLGPRLHVDVLRVTADFVPKR
ncbi:MAG: hypothetical protein ACRERC_20915 [Candidatus Binatia bacterium]